MQVTEDMLAPTRTKFADAHATLPVKGLSDLYNEVEHGVPPLFDKRYPDSVWKEYVRLHGFVPPGPQLDTPTDEWKPSWFHARAFSDDVALVLAFVDRVPPLSDAREWYALVHVGQGVRRHHTGMVATEIEPRAEVLPVLTEIARSWHHSELATDLRQFYPEAKPAVEASIATYRKQLAALALTWTGAQPLLMEALYPIDATQAALDILAVDAPELAAVTPVAPEEARPVILLLAMNSD